jgi:hypothetical protein
MPGADGSAGKPPMFATQPSPDWILSQGVPNIMGSAGFGRPSSASLARKRNRGASEADGFVIEVGAEIRVAPTQPWPPASAARGQAGTARTKSRRVGISARAPNSLLRDSNSLHGIKFGSKIPCKTA